MKIIDFEQIKQSIDIVNDFDALLISQKTAFIDFSEQLYHIPEPMQFFFSQFKSDCHIKAGYRQGSENFVIKIASGTPFGNNGIIFICRADTGETKAMLQDKGILTTLRTALAGIIVTELVPWEIKNIGIIGSGHLAAQVYDLIGIKYPQLTRLLYARNKTKAISITSSVCDSIEELLEKCDVIFTTTSATTPFIYDIPERVDKVIIALGSDDHHKSELSPYLFKKANRVIVDSKSQATKFSDVANALKLGIITEDIPIELGIALKKGKLRTSGLIIADFSGIGVQDVAMAEFILSKIS